jgi:drug/metabolite transporter (DMT)-like permease
VRTFRKHPGIVAALAAAVLFGASVPLSKLLLDAMSPWLLAGLLYLGSGLGLAAWRRWRGAPPAAMSAGERGWFAAAVACGGIVGPVLLMWGLSMTDAAAASLLLNAEGVLTALIAWFVFRENVDRRIAAGMLCIVAGATVLSWPKDVAEQSGFGSMLPALAIIGACLAWAIDNNLTRKVSLIDASFLAMVKGIAAGVTNVALALAAGVAIPGFGSAFAAGVLGFLSYGSSLVLFVIALRHLGTARTGAYFSVAPFAGAVIALLLLAEPLTPQLAAAALLMGIGVWLHITERHVHEHTHDAFEHDHVHEHDEHHQHAHDAPVAPGTRHRHHHRHERMTHTHAHYPDAHHRHRH